jgi:hypothetical protein
MSTLKQIDANRQNAQRSTGPRTPAGKAASRFNALKSGIDAQAQVIPGEDPAQLEALLAEYQERFDASVPERRTTAPSRTSRTWGPPPPPISLPRPPRPRPNRPQPALPNPPRPNRINNLSPKLGSFRGLPKSPLSPAQAPIPSRERQRAVRFPQLPDRKYRNTKYNPARKAAQPVRIAAVRAKRSMGDRARWRPSGRAWLIVSVIVFSPRNDPECPF